MSASGAILNLQSALNCAGKCDCCDKLQSQINDFKAQLSAIDGKYILKSNKAAIINNAKIQAKDLIMPLLISYVLSQLKPIQQVISGIEGSLFALSGQITNFVSRLSALELSVINSLKTAASAL